MARRGKMREIVKMCIIHICTEYAVKVQRQLFKLKLAQYVSKHKMYS